jgi:hypothetical protein
MIIFPARTIESDVVLLASHDRRVIDKDIRYEESDHHRLSFARLHARLYPRNGNVQSSSWEFVPEELIHTIEDSL